MLGHSHRGEDAIAALEVGRGIQVAGARKVNLDDFLDRGRPAAHDQDAVGQLDRLVDVVGDEEDRLAFGFPDPDEVGPHLEPGDVVEGAERLVHVEDLGVRRQGSGDFDALPHAAGEFAGVGPSKPVRPTMSM